MKIVVTNTPTSMVNRAVETFIKAGRKNGGNIELDPSDDEVFDRLYHDDIRAPGVITIPVCSGEEAFSNWSDGRAVNQDLEFFPCNNN